jgi:hypothetical protein
MDPIYQVVIAFVSGTALKYVLDWWRGKRADDSSVAAKLRDELRDEVARLGGENRLLRDENVQLRVENMQLKGELGEVRGRMLAMEGLLGAFLRGQVPATEPKPIVSSGG